MEPAEASTEKRMKLRYPGVCRVCGVDLAARQKAIYERAKQDRAVHRVPDRC
jgi:hypothetical protein